MKKFLLMAFLMLSFSMSAEDSYWGVNASVNIASPSSNGDDFNAGAGFSFGGTYTASLWKGLYVEPGLGFYYNTWSLDLFETSESGFKEDAVDNSFRNFGMSVPVMIGWQFKFTDGLGLKAFTGPQLNIGFTNKFHVSKTDDGTKFSTSSDMYDSFFNRVDLGWRFGAAVLVNHWQFGVSGVVGCTNIYKGEYEPLKTNLNTVYFSVGYNF